MNTVHYRLKLPVVLIGMPTCGKTTIGHAFGAHYGIPFNDSDALIVAAAGKSIARLFTEEGEAAFRAQERTTLARLLTMPNNLIAAGGGAFIEAETRALLKQQAHVIWLHVAMPVLLERLSSAMAAERPLLQGTDAAAKLHALWDARASIYAEASARLDISNMSVWESLAALKQHLHTSGIMLEQQA